MKSIRLYLLLSLLAIITLVTFLSLLHGYRSSMAQAQTLFDQRLRSMAEIIANANQNTQTRDSAVFESLPTVFYQVWSADLVLLAHSNNAPRDLVFDVNRQDVFKDNNFNGYRWRTFILKDPHLDRWIITGERSDVRYSLAEKVVLASIIPIVFAIPIMGLIIWLAIGFGLKPLRNLGKQLNNKQANDLSPVEMTNVPIELAQLVATTNRLLVRLNAAFIREQQFSADAAHELRTPISVLKVQMHNLLNKHDASHEDMLEMAAGIDRMSYVVEQILSLYRHSPDQALLSMEQVDLAAISKTMIANSYQQFENKGQTIDFQSDEGCLLTANKFALETLIANLISNACKYTPKGGKVKVAINKLAHQRIRLCVEDSGPGIPESDYKRVFERFYRVGSDRHNSEESGCGLGLSIVKNIVSMHNADISMLTSQHLGGLKMVVDFQGD